MPYLAYRDIIMAFPEKRIRELYDQVAGDQDKLFELLMKEFGWTREQAYIATEFLYRPPNMN